MLNKVIIMGRLTRDPEIKKVNNDISVCSFSIACDRDIVNKQNNERETDFFDVTAWRSTADFVGKYFGKGRMIVVVGRLQKRNYTDKDGNKRSAVDIIAENVYFGDSKKDGETSDNASASTTGYAAGPSQNSDFANVGEEDGELPF
jgi:single-strand DNA-binding protein